MKKVCVEELREYSSLQTKYECRKYVCRRVRRNRSCLETIIECLLRKKLEFQTEALACVWSFVRAHQKCMVKSVMKNRWFSKGNFRKSRKWALLCSGCHHKAASHKAVTIVYNGRIVSGRRLKYQKPYTLHRRRCWNLDKTSYHDETTKRYEIQRTDLDYKAVCMNM